jgi:hypothetical protein
MLNLRHLRRLVPRPDPFAIEPALEVVYARLFQRELARLGEEDRFFPVGGAANYSLLYLILRIATELHPVSVLDIGAGQSTLLWSMLREKGLVSDVLTLEHDAAWGARIGAQVAHDVTVAPLKRMSVDGRSVMTYDWDPATAGRAFDMVVCDGPIGTARHSRRGLLSMLGVLPADFAIILDDAERVGEQDTVTAVHDRLQGAGVQYAMNIVRAAKTQAVFAAGRFIPATFL